MSLGPCFAKLQRELRDFDTSDVREAAKVYASRGMEDKAANVAAIEDHLRELRQARQRVVDHVLEQWKTRDPEGYANAARPALDLKGETEGEVRTREAQQAKEAEQQRKVANAPSEKGFTLTGSDRPADEAEARGQKAMFSRKPTYYSELARQVDNAKTASAPAAQWKSFIDNLKSKGVKADEIEWSGVKDWLDLQQGKVTKDQVQQFLRDNGVKVEETALGDADDVGYAYAARSAAQAHESQQALMRLLEERLKGEEINQVQRANLANWGLAAEDDRSYSDEKAQANEKIGALGLSDASEAALRAWAKATLEAQRLADARDALHQGTATRYEAYKLPGGENYRELLLTLPERKAEEAPSFRVTEDGNGSWSVVNAQGEKVLTAGTREYAEQRAGEFNGQGGLPSHLRGREGDGNFRSSHFDLPNILAHVRFDERTDAQGKKVLFIEEIQSDWAQKGKREGFKGEGAVSREEYTAASRRAHEAVSRNDDLGFDSWQEAVNAVRSHEDWQARWGDGMSADDVAALNEYRRVNEAYTRNVAGVPPAPFVGKTEAWVSLAVKRMVRYAAEHDFDRVAWTTGEQQAERYQLSKHINKVTYEERTGAFKAVGNDSRIAIDRTVKPAELADLIGKEASARLMQKAPNVNGIRVLHGLELKVGGEGMKAFYDKIVPNVVNDVLKKVGGGRVDAGYLGRDENNKLLANDDVAHAGAIGAIPQPGFDITPKMREEAMQGLPLFKRGAEEPAKAKTSPTGGMKEEDARAALKGAVENTKVPIRVVQSVKDLPFEAPADAKGAFHDGKIWAVADNLSDALDAERTIARHEVTHAGLDILYGDSRAREVALTKVVAANPKIREIARAWRDQYGDGIRDQAKAEGMKADAVEREVRLASFEEGLAHFAEEGNEIRGWQQFVAVIQKGLRSMGLDRVADWLEHATNAEAMSLIDQARKATMEPKAAETSRLQPAFSRVDTADNVRDTPSHGRLFAKVKDFASSWIEELQKAVTPMAAGSDRARAVAKDYANAERVAREQWARVHERLSKSYTPEQLKRMWQAADEENVLRQTGESTKGRGLDRLQPDERAEVERLHKYANGLLEQAKQVGMFQGEGLPYWTPRLIANIGKDGEIAEPHGLGTPSSPFTSPHGRNITTTAASLRERKHLTAAETEAAAKAKFGENAEVVQDIRAMPLAMARLERAIAGRQLIESIRDIGNKTGEEIVSSGDKPGFFTIDAPAFKTFRPRFEEVDGKTQAVKDSAGNIVFDKTPLYVAKEFEGPLKAIMADKPGKIYSALMGVKSRAMGLIMYSPLIHNGVEWGRALPLMPGKVATFRIYFEGNRIRKDDAAMRHFVENGMVPIGKRFQNQDISGIVEEPSLKAGRSLTAKALGAAVGAVNKAAGEATKRGVDKAGDFWHNTLLWERVADLQAGIAANMRDDLMRRGMDDVTATRIASHLANRFAGALPNEAMSAMARKVANLSLFSRTFTLGNLGVMKDLVTGLPKDVQAQIKRDAGELARKAAVSVARRKAVHAFMLDIALMYAGNAALQSAFDYWRRDKSLDEITQGYARRMNRMLGRIKENPLQLLNIFGNVQSLSPTSDNEPGKENRVLFGYAKDGTAMYVRLPTGKIGEEFEGWLTSPLDMLKRKESTLLRPTIQAATNDKGFGRPVYDDKAKGFPAMVKATGNIAWNYMSQQLPMDQITSVHDLMAGRGDDQVNALKVAGPLAGVTFSKGAPGGPEVGQLFQAENEHRADVQRVLPDVKQLIADGKRSDAISLMREHHMTASEIQITLKYATNPASRMGPRRMQRFNEIASPDELEAMRRLRQRSDSAPATE